MAADVSGRLLQALLESWVLITRLGPYVLLGVAAAVALERLLSRPRLKGVLVAAGNVPTAIAVGAVSPLCTYGTVPLLYTLRRHGVPLSAVLAFLVSSSMLNPQLFLLLWGGLGPGFALAQAAGVAAIAAGAASLGGRGFGTAKAPPGGPPHGAGEHHPHTGASLAARAVELGGFVGLHFLAGVLLASLLRQWLPTAWVVGALGADRWYAPALAGLAGVPLYACGGGAVPLVVTLGAMGMSPGAARAFFLAGPATRVTAVAAVAPFLGRGATVAYVAYVVAAATAAGWALNLVARGQPLPPTPLP